MARWQDQAEVSKAMASALSDVQSWLCAVQGLSSDWGAGAPGTVESSLSICHVCRARKRLGTHLNLLVLGTSLFFHSSREN